MIIKLTDRIYGADGKLVSHNYHGLRREKFTGKDINELREGGHDWFIYIRPEGYDPSINKLDGAISFDAPTCTEGLIELTEEEIAARLEASKIGIGY